MNDTLAQDWNEKIGEKRIIVAMNAMSEQSIRRPAFIRRLPIPIGLIVLSRLNLGVRGDRILRIDLTQLVRPRVLPIVWDRHTLALHHQHPIVSTKRRAQIYGRVIELNSLYIEGGPCGGESSKGLDAMAVGNVYSTLHL